MMKPNVQRSFVARVGAPFVDESLLGYVSRALSVTAVRQLPTMLRLADATKPNSVAMPTTLVERGETERIAALFGCEPQDIASRTYTVGTFEHSGTESLDFFGTKIRHHYREGRIRRVSPRALEIAQYHRAQWEARPFTFDPQTKEMLLDTCPVCHRKLGWLRVVGSTLCDKCVDSSGVPNVDLRDFPQPVAAVEDEEALDFATNLIDPDPAKKQAARLLLPESWSDFSNADLFEAVVALASGLTLDPAASPNAQGRSKRKEQFENLTPDMLALSGRALIGGDDGFAQLCERYRADMETRPHHYGRRKELGPLAYITYDRHLHPGIRDALGTLIDGNMRFTCRDFTLRNGKDADDALLPISGLAETFNVRPSILRRLAQSGLVPVVRAQDASRSPVRMAVGDLLPLLVQMKDAIGENEAAGMLGLPLSVLPNLCDRGLIKRLEGPVLGLVPGYSGYTKSSVQELMEKVWSAVRPSRGGKSCSIVVAARSIGAGETPWAAVISGIVSGDIEVSDTGAQRRNIRFSLAVEDVPSFVAGVRKHVRRGENAVELPEWIGNSTAAEILKVTEAFLSRLFKLRPDILRQRGTDYTPYPSGDVRALAEKYIFVPEITLRGEMHARRAVAWLRSNGVEPDFALQDNRDFAFLRKKVEPLLARQVADEAQRAAALPTEADDLRTRLVKAVAGGAEIKATAKNLGVGYREAVRWVAKWRTTGMLEPEKNGKKSPLDREAEWFRNLVAGEPGISLAAIKQKLAARNVRSSQTAIWRCLQRNGIERGVCHRHS